MKKPTAQKKFYQLTKPFLSDGCSGIPDTSPEASECCDKHDFEYAYRGKYSWDFYHALGQMRSRDKPKSRLQADRDLRECMIKHAKEDKLWSGAVYWAVRLFGWMPWWNIDAKLVLALLLVALGAVVILSGCTTYHVTTPSGWEAKISTVRKLDGAKVKATKDGDLEVEFSGVDTADPWKSLPQYIPWPYPVPGPAPMPQSNRQSHGKDGEPISIPLVAW